MLQIAKNRAEKIFITQKRQQRTSHELSLKSILKSTCQSSPWKKKNIFSFLASKLIVNLPTPLGGMYFQI